jgi:hypothetical protein
MLGLDPGIHHTSSNALFLMDCRVIQGKDALGAFAWQ